MDLQEENRKQIRAFRKFIENYASLSDRLENALHNISETVANMRRQDTDSLLRSVREETSRDIYKSILDVRDSLVRGVKKTRFHLDKMSALRKMAAGAPLLNSLIEGQEVALQRLDDCLRYNRIMEMDAKGKVFDPHTMCVTATLETDAVPEGTVVEILRPGYMMGDAVLRCAEVRVARPPSPTEKEQVR
jgi:molecular chaperone GrpE